MKHRPRVYYTETDKALMWDRWQKGDSHAIDGLSDTNENASESDDDYSGVRGVIIGLYFGPKIATENNNVFERTNSKKPG